MANLIFLLLPRFQTKNTEIPIKIYKTVHAGPNSQFGGLKNGLLSVTYQVFIELEVARDPKNATNKQPPIEMVNFCQFFTPHSVSAIGNHYHMRYRHCLGPGRHIHTHLVDIGPQNTKTYSNRSLNNYNSNFQNW